jgi:hypothetical protein
MDDRGESDTGMDASEGSDPDYIPSDMSPRNSQEDRKKRSYKQNYIVNVATLLGLFH